ncbi:hypothetical protein Droror1_Dr00023117 [Drosera rotundifolia]
MNFKELLGTDKSHTQICLNVLRSGPLISTDIYDQLDASFSERDVKIALVGIDDDKVREPDRYTAHFFKKAWKIVGKDVTATLLQFLNNGQLSKQLNCTAISLIAKNPMTCRISEYRSIYCCIV